MKKDVDCGVIRDLLPLYEDGAASEESQELVRAHLKDCPECREELRKMRVPVSVPPDEDEEAVKRFLERRAEIRRKRNRRLAGVLVPLALVLVFCLCYTLIPRSWKSVGGGVEPDRIMGSYLFPRVEAGEPYIDRWSLDEERDSGSGVVEAVMDTLRAGTYRAKLGNLMNHIPFLQTFQSGYIDGFGSTVYLYFVKENDTVGTIMLYDTDRGCEAYIEAGDDPGTFGYRIDRETYYALVALMQEYGEFRP